MRSVLLCPAVTLRWCWWLMGIGLVLGGWSVQVVRADASLPSLSAAAAGTSALPPPWLVTTGRSSVRARSGVVASSQPLAARAGLEVLAHGGNAVDAAIAMAGVLAVVEPGMSGLGGDAFALLYLAKTGEVRALNASGWAPQAMTRSYFSGKSLTKIPLTGWDSVTVPGAVAGWAALQERYGTRSLSALLSFAIEYAEQGFPVMEKTAEDWAQFAAKLKADPAARATLLVGDRAPHAGELFRQPQLAKTLRVLAKEGRKAFYEGAIARSIAEAARSQGGLLSYADLAEYKAQWVEPIATLYRGHRIFECPPNGQGITALLVLNLLSGFDLAQLAKQPADYYHTLIEATKLAFADRDRYLADPNAEPVPVARLLSAEYATQRRQLISAEHALSAATPGALGAGDTSYVVVADKDGNVVSYIGSLYMMLGSGVVAGETGILLQDRAAGFSLDAHHPNRLEPRKRPAHTIIPALVTKDGKPVLALGVVGGDMQPQAQVQILSGLIDLGLPLQQALEAPRFFFQGGREVVFEKAIPASVIENLTARGHLPAAPKPPWTLRAIMGGVQAVRIDPEHKTLEAASDPRKDGLALGY